MLIAEVAGSACVRVGVYEGHLRLKRAYVARAQLLQRVWMRDPGLERSGSWLPSPGRVSISEEDLFFLKGGQDTDPGTSTGMTFLDSTLFQP